MLLVLRKKHYSQKKGKTSEDLWIFQSQRGMGSEGGKVSKKPLLCLHGYLNTILFNGSRIFSDKFLRDSFYIISMFEGLFDATLSKWYFLYSYI